MQHVELKPDQLTLRAQAAVSATFAIEYDEAQSALLVRSLLAQLRRNEFVLVIALVRQRQRWEADHDFPLCLSIRQLMDLIQSTSAASLCRQLTTAALKVAALGIYIYPLRGEDAYFVLYAKDVGKQHPAETERDLPITVIP